MGDLLHILIEDMGKILHLLQGGTPTAEGLERWQAWNAVMLPLSIAAAVAVMIWVWGGFFLRLRRYRRDG